MDVLLLIHLLLLASGNDDDARHLLWYPRHNVWTAERGNGKVWTRNDEDWYLTHKGLIQMGKQGPRATAKDRHRLGRPVGSLPIGFW